MLKALDFNWLKVHPFQAIGFKMCHLAPLQRGVLLRQRQVRGDVGAVLLRRDFALRDAGAGGSGCGALRVQGEAVQVDIRLTLG